MTTLTPLRVLFVEDSQDDTILIVYSLQRCYQLTYLRVDNAQGMSDALQSPWDAIVCDYTLPSFSVEDALSIMKKKGLDLPFIVVSGTIDEEIASSVMRAGAHDFVSKYRLTRLVPAIERELREAETRSKRKQAEIALSESEEQLRLALEAARMGTWDINLLTNRLTWSSIHEQLFGLEPGTFDGSYEMFEACVYPEDWESIFQAVNLAQKNRKKYHHEFRVVWPDGSIHWIEAQGRFFYDGSGQAVRMIGTVMDISLRKEAEAVLRQVKAELEINVAERTIALTQANDRLQKELSDRKRAEAALRESEARLAAILQNAPAVIYLKDVQGRYILTNPHFENLFSSPKGQILGKTDRDLFPKEMADSFRSNDLQVITQGVPLEFEEIALQRGSIRTYISIKFPIKDETGAIYGICGISTDISDRVAAEEERKQLITQQKQIAATLQESSRRWRTLMDNVRLLVVGLDRTGHVEYVNPFFLELTEYAKAEAIDKDWFETFLPQHQKQRAYDRFTEIQQHNVHPYYINSILTKSGSERIIAWNNTLLQDLEGEVIGTLSIGEDITERYAIERIKDEFISVVSHELRTPLTSIHGALNLLSTGLIQPQSSKGTRVIQIAAESAERLVRLVNDILELERLESGKISLSKQLCNTIDLLTRATEMIQVMTDRAEINLVASSQNIQIEADSDRIIQVLTNLLSNAIKFSDPGSQIWLNVEQELTGDRNILFQVKDIGRGIPFEKIESIFERFHQVDASDSRQKGGTGLGLAICRSIVQQHGGRIWVESTLGEGSCFYFTLPVS